MRSVLLGLTTLFALAGLAVLLSAAASADIGPLEVAIVLVPFLLAVVCFRAARRRV